MDMDSFRTYEIVPRRDLESQSTTTVKSAKSHSVRWHLLIDVPLLLLVVTLIGLYEHGIIPSYKSGFFCNDPKLSYPFNGDTVSGNVLTVTLLLLPIVFFITTELLLLRADSFRSRASKALRRTGVLYRSYGYGFCFNFIIVEVMKGVTGMPRPVFFALCAPDTNANCTTGEYISTFECTSSYSWWTQYDSYHSFPSGHTSTSIYCGLFIAWYLQRRAFSWSSRTVMLVPFLQLLCACYAALCSLSRITDNRHHWWDVTVGACVGVVTAVFVIFATCDNFSTVRKEEDGSRAR